MPTRSRGEDGFAVGLGGEECEDEHEITGLPAVAVDGDVVAAEGLGTASTGELLQLFIVQEGVVEVVPRGGDAGCLTCRSVLTVVFYPLTEFVEVLRACLLRNAPQRSLRETTSVCDERHVV